MEAMAWDRNWIWCLAAGIVCAATAADFLRRRRLLRFGEPRLLGVRTGWTVRLIPGVLMAAAVAAAASVIPKSLERQADGPVRSLIFLVDSGWAEPAAGRGSLLTESIRTLGGKLPGVQVSAYRAGAAAEPLIPATWDFRGALVLAERIGQQWRPSRDSADLQPDLNAVAAPAAAEGSGGTAVVILTGRSAEEVQRRALRPPGGARLLCLPVPAGSNPQLGVCSGEGKWTWLDVDGSLPALLEPAQSGAGPLARLRSLSVVQLLAAGALLVLTADILWALYAAA